MQFALDLRRIACVASDFNCLRLAVELSTHPWRIQRVPTCIRRWSSACSRSTCSSRLGSTSSRKYLQRNRRPLVKMRINILIRMPTARRFTPWRHRPTTQSRSHQEDSRTKSEEEEECLLLLSQAHCPGKYVFLMVVSPVGIHNCRGQYKHDDNSDYNFYTVTAMKRCLWGSTTLAYRKIYMVYSCNDSIVGLYINRSGNMHLPRETQRGWPRHCSHRDAAVRHFLVGNLMGLSMP